MPLSDADLVARLRRVFAARGQPDSIAAAVSGGSDSVALLHLLGDWARAGGPAVHVVTLDHHLRPASAQEAAGVADLAAALGMAHCTLHWQGGSAQGNLMDAARRARLAQIGAWARAEGIGCVATGHTADDQAETFVLRLARGSGVDGLSGMAVWRRVDGVDWVRPLLEVPRADLRAMLQRRGQGWIDDPSNDDPHFDRAKVRAALPELDRLGLSRDRLLATVRLMALARQALEQAADAAALRVARIEAGEVVFDPPGFDALPRETRLRLLARALAWVGGGDYRPRLAALERVLATVALAPRDGPAHRTLCGCALTRDRRGLRVGREVAAAQHAPPAPVQGASETVWDGRWRLVGTEVGLGVGLGVGPGVGTGDPALEVRALGASGLAKCPDWRATGLARATLLASPAVWRGSDLVAAPLAGRPDGWQALPARDPVCFFSSLLSH